MDCRIPNQALNWNPSSTNRKPERPRKNWQDIIRRDLKDIGLTWDEASELAHPRSSCRQSVAQCVFDTGRTRVSGQAAMSAKVLPKVIEPCSSTRHCWLPVASLPALGPWAPPPAERGPSLESIYRVSLIQLIFAKSPSSSLPSLSGRCEGNKIISF